MLSSYLKLEGVVVSIIFINDIDLQIDALRSIVDLHYVNVLIVSPEIILSPDVDRMTRIMRCDERAWVAACFSADIHSYQSFTKKAKDVRTLLFRGSDDIHMKDLLVGHIVSVRTKHSPLGVEENRASKQVWYSQTVKVYSDVAFAEDYFEKWKEKVPFEKIKRFLSYIELESIVLDAGCGPGHHANSMVSLGYNVVGLDLSPAAIRIARLNWKRPIFVNVTCAQSIFPTVLFREFELAHR